MNTNEFLEKQKFEFIEKYVEEYKNKKIRLSKLLRYLKPILIQLIKENYTVIEMREFIENSFEIEINYNPFYRWIKRNLSDVDSNNFDDVIIKNDTKTIIKKEKKNDLKTTPKKVVKETKNDSVSSSKMSDEELQKLANADINVDEFLN